MKEEVGVRISDAGPDERPRLEPILEESFEGWYLRHSRSTLYGIPTVRVAEVDGRAVGLAMLKSLERGVGYVYYIAVAKDSRRMGFGSRLLDDALDYFRGVGVETVYASVENEEAAALFRSKGFAKTHFGEVVSSYGLIRALAMYRSMVVVPGEVLLRLDLDEGRRDTKSSSRA